MTDKTMRESGENTMSEFKRENRYVVLKISRLHVEELLALKDFIDSYQLTTEDCAVVEHDWPIYDETWENIQRLAEGRPSIKEEAQSQQAQVPEVSDHNVRLISQSMAFLASAIKSGEAWSEQCQHIYDRAQNTLSEIASPAPDHSGDENKMVGWISVDERLPEPGITVMVYAPPQPGDYADDVRIGFDSICPESDGDYWLDHGEHYEHYSMVAKGGEGWGGPSVQAPYTHWMPLPNPPQQEEAEPVVQCRHPCGCVTCICEDDEQCQGCGATACDDYSGPSCGCTHQQEEEER